MADDNNKNSLQKTTNNQLNISTGSTSIIDQALSRLSDDQLKEISNKALDEALNLEAMGKKVGFEYQLGQRQLFDHIDTVERLNNTSHKAHHEVSTSLNVGDNRTYVKSEVGKKCFVATAVYNDENHASVERLRRYRDEILCQSVGGRIFITLYYKFGRYLAGVVETRPRLKMAIKKVLDRFIHRLDNIGA
jgi:hypothetical protein